jgi:CRP-like cAMP-binding protein
MVEPLIRKLEQFTELRRGDKQALRDGVSKVVEFAPREDIIRQGDRPDSVHLLLTGWAARYKLRLGGEHPIMAYLIPGDLCDVHITVLKEMDHAIGALSACEVAYFPRDHLFRLMTERPQLGLALWWATLVDEAILREWLVNIGTRQAPQRLAHLICEMLLRSRAVGLTQDDSFELPLTQEQLGDSLGTSTVHVNRTLQELRSQGLIATDGKRIVVQDLEALMAFCDFDPLYLHQEAQDVEVRAGAEG